MAITTSPAQKQKFIDSAFQSPITGNKGPAAYGSSLHVACVSALVWLPYPQNKNLENKYYQYPSFTHIASCYHLIVVKAPQFSWYQRVILLHVAAAIYLVNIALILQQYWAASEPVKDLQTCCSAFVVVLNMSSEGVWGVTLRSPTTQSQSLYACRCHVDRCYYYWRRSHMSRMGIVQARQASLLHHLQEARKLLKAWSYLCWMVGEQTCERRKFPRPDVMRTIEEDTFESIVCVGEEISSIKIGRWATSDSTIASYCE